MISQEILSTLITRRRGYPLQLWSFLAFWRLAPSMPVAHNAQGRIHCAGFHPQFDPCFAGNRTFEHRILPLPCVRMDMDRKRHSRKAGRHIRCQRVTILALRLYPEKMVAESPCPTICSIVNSEAKKEPVSEDLGRHYRSSWLSIWMVQRSPSRRSPP